RTDRNPDRLGNLLVGEILHLSHHERDAVVFVHTLNGGSDRLPQLRAVGLLLRVGLSRLELHRTRGRTGAGMVRTQLREGSLPASRTVAELVLQQIVR